MLKVSRINNNNKLKRDLETTITSLKIVEGFDGEMKISVYDINTGLQADVNGKNSGWAASIIKVPIMVEAINQLETGLINSKTKIRTNRRFILETYDALSKFDNDVCVGLSTLLYQMIVNSDNTATNMLANKLGIVNINKTMQKLKMNKSMMGHLLCPNVPRYISSFNPDGSNITCPNDMVLLFRHLYDSKVSSLTPQARKFGDYVLSYTSGGFLRSKSFINSRIKAKPGVIHDAIYGADIHEAGIIDDHLIVCIMLNKVGQKGLGRRKELLTEETGASHMSLFPSTNICKVYQDLMETVAPYALT